MHAPAPPRVLMTADTVGGVFSYAVELARAVAERGIEVELATMGAPLSTAQRKEVRGLSVHESSYRLEWMEEPWEDVARAGAWLMALEERLTPDLVHLNGYAHAALPFRAPKLVVAHSCVCSWYRAVKGHGAPRSWERYRREVARGVACADAVVAPTWAMLEAVTTHHGRPERASVIPNARDPERFQPGPKEPFILAAGRVWDEAKNIAALGAVATRLPWPVRVAGSDVSPDGARRAVPGVEALGAVSAEGMRALFARASIYALPARYEPFGLSVLEAALSGCALVLGDIASLRELWDGAARFVDPGDADALERALHALIDDPDARREAGLRARRRALVYAPAPMASAYLHLYRELRGAKRRARCA